MAAFTQTYAKNGTQPVLNANILLDRISEVRHPDADTAAHGLGGPGRIVWTHVQPFGAAQRNGRSFDHENLCNRLYDRLGRRAGLRMDRLGRTCGRAGRIANTQYVAGCGRSGRRDVVLAQNPAQRLLTGEHRFPHTFKGGEI